MGCGRSNARAALGLALGAAMMLGGPGCTGGPEPGAVQIQVTGAALSGADVAQLEITVFGPDIDPPIVEVLDADGSSWRGAVTGIPPGTGRVIEARAYDDTGSLIYQGRADGITVNEGEVATVWLTLQQVTPPPIFINLAPRFVSLVASASQVDPGGVIALRADATDPNGGPLTYAWTATAGTFVDSTGAYTEWTAPDATGAGPQTLTVSVTDPQGATATARLVVIVGDPQDGGAAVVGVDVNSAPVVERVTANAPSFDVGEPVRIDVTANDPDGDSLAFHWYAFCWGTFVDDRAEDPTFTLQALPSAGQDCVFLVRVDDGRGGTAYGLFVAATGPAPELTVGIPVPGEPDATVTDPLGNAYALWTGRDEDGFERILGNRFTPHDGWEATSFLDVPSPRDRRGLQLVLEPNGDALAFWGEHGIDGTFWTSAYHVGAGWDAVPLRLGGGYDGNGFELATNPEGIVTAVWHADDTGSEYYGFGVHAARFDPDLGWGPDERISGAEPEGLFPHVKMDDAGNALVMWRDYDYGNPDPIYRWCYHEAGIGWGSPEPFGPLLDSFVMHAEGDAVAYYMETVDGEVVLYARTFDPATGWSDPVVVQTPEGSTSVQLTLD